MLALKCQGMQIQPTFCRLSVRVYLDFSSQPACDVHICLCRSCCSSVHDQEAAGSCWCCFCSIITEKQKVFFHNLGFLQLHAKRD